MTGPGLELSRLAGSLALGVGLGILYGFLRYLRPRFLGDLLFVAACWGAWLQLAFGICGGDIRLGYSLGLAAGALAEEWTLGRLFRPLYRLFWHGIGKIWGLFSWPFRKICIIFRKFCKFLLAGAKKWVTIRKESKPGGGHPEVTAPWQEKFESDW